MKKILASLLIACISPLYAANENHTLNIHVTNESKYNLQFESVEGCNPGNHFMLPQKMLKPGEHAVITVEKLANSDIAGKVIFSNSAGDVATLLVLDQEQVHFGQPVFNVVGEKYYSELVSRVRNKNVGPRYLTYVEASLRVMDRG